MLEATSPMPTCLSPRASYAAIQPRRHRQSAAWRQRPDRIAHRRRYSTPRRSKSGPTSTACTTTIPAYVEGTAPVAELHFDEAAELAYFGAKILHPCLRDAGEAQQHTHPGTQHDGARRRAARLSTTPCTRARSRPWRPKTASWLLKSNRRACSWPPDSSIVCLRYSIITSVPSI